MGCNQTTNAYWFFLLCSFFLLTSIQSKAFSGDTSSRFHSYGDTLSTLSVSGKIKTFLALGDSYTIGQSVDSSERFPAQTAAILKHYGYAVNDIDYIATTGWKTVNLQWAIEAQRSKKRYDIVTLLIGVNDQYLKKDTTGYREHFTNLLLKAITYANGNSKHVFVLSLPDYGVTPFGKTKKEPARQINQFNTINKQVAYSFDVNYVNITNISRNDAKDATMLAPDDMHPSGKQYAQWAHTLSDTILTVLK